MKVLEGKLVATKGKFAIVGARFNEFIVSKLMSIAMKPVAFPPFPLERIEELTALMGGDGAVR